MKLSTRDLPMFFAPEHFALGELLERTVRADDAALHDAKSVIPRLAALGLLDYVLPRASGAVDVRSLCLVREALGQASPLADAIFAVQGLGSHPIALTPGFRDGAALLGRVSRGEITMAFALTEPEAGSDVAALATRAGTPAFQIENRLKLQGTAVVHDRIVIPAALFRGLTEKRVRERPSTIYHLYQSEFGVTVVRARERLGAVAADRSIARALGVSPGVPVLQVRRTAIALGGRPVEYRVSTIVTTAHDYVNQLSRPS